MAQEGTRFLKQKYDLHNAPEVKTAAKRTEGRTGERVPQYPDSQIQNYLDRFNELIVRADPDERRRGVEALKRSLHDKVVIKPSDVPESTFLLEQRLARDDGHGDVEITDDYRKKKIDQIISNQTLSLDKWIDYLASGEAQYPDWAKYWTLRSVVEMGKYVKEVDRQEKEVSGFNKRDKDTTASFPTLNPRALAMTIGVVRSRLAESQKPKAERQSIENRSKVLGDEDFQNLLASENFAKIYTQFLIELPEYSTEGLQETRGKWVTYAQGSDPKPLVDSLAGYPLEWCTADLDTARDQLADGDFHVYYSINEQGEAVIPRLAIRMMGGHIGEDPRGIAPKQNLDPYIGDVLEKRLKDFGQEGERYKKKSSDMKRVTAIENSVKAGVPLNRDELKFLYELDSRIEGFGREDDPRINELRKARNPKEDAPNVFDCRPDQIAYRQEDISENTKAFIGPLFSGIFNNHSTLDHIYTSFPEGKIRFQNLTIGGKTSQELQDALADPNFKITDDARSHLSNNEFHTLKLPENITTVRLKARDLGFTGTPKIDQVYARAQQLGLELCPAETGPHMRLIHKDQPVGEWLNIGMKHLADYPRVFSLGRLPNGLWLHYSWPMPSTDSHPEYEFIFALPKKIIKS